MLQVQNFSITADEYRRLQQSERRLQTRVFDKHAQDFVKIAMKQFGLSVEDAEEVVSSAFAKMFYKIEKQGLVQDNLEGYVFTIIKHKSFEITEKKQKNILKTTDSLPETADVEDVNDDTLHLINAAFNRLGERCQKLLSGFYWEDKDHKEIASAFGITEEASRQRKRECMKKLRQLLGKEPSETPLPC